MRGVFLSVLAAAAAGCTTSSVDAKPTVRSQGLGSDLRVVFDSTCLPPQSESANIPGTRSVDLLADLAIGAGTLLFKTFGQMLQEAAAPKVDRSSAVRGGFMFTGGDASSFNRDVACIHIVRGGFDGSSQDITGAPELVTTWKRLGLRNTPSLYAEVRLTPAAQAPAYFSGELLRFVVPEFERSDGRGERDYLLVMEFERPVATAFVQQDDSGGFIFAEPGAFARGVFKLTDVKRNTLLGDADLKYLDTGLMPIGTDGSGKDTGAFNLYVDVVEFKRGDPQLADLAALLRSDRIETSATKAITQSVRPDDARRERDKERFDLMDVERKLMRELETATRSVTAELDGPNPSKSKLIAARDALDDALADLNRQIAISGWASPESPNPRLEGARELLRRAQAAVR